ncbi:hypothetical protein LXA43DRAFT_975985 [Ganoderma leucocontextum]|nr:hypothetical protein LXA43DRAFT_975985 [Ganoderma leucocontextum]
MSDAETAQEFDERIAQTQSGAAEVQDFVLKTSYAFPAADVLLPAPMAVSILGQLTLVATTADFKFIGRSGGYKHIRYPDSFRATIIQLVNTGALTLNRSFTNFNEIHQLCGAVRPGVNNIVQLLVGHPDSTPVENDLALKGYLPDQIESLSGTVQACLHRAKETHSAFDDLLKLTMEIHEACTATQGDTEMRVHEEKLRMAALEKEQAATEEMKRISKDIFDTAQESFANAQTTFHDASGDMPGVGELFLSSMADAALCAVNFVTFNSLGLSSNRSNNDMANTTTAEDPAPDTRDPAWQKASALREHAETLSMLLTAGPGGRPDWTTIKSPEAGGCADIWVNLEEIEKALKKKKNAGKPTERALALTRKGIDYAHRLHDVVPPGGDQTKMEELASTVADWCDNVVEFSAQADLKLKTSPFKRQAFVTQQANTAGRMPITTTRINQARYKLEVAEGQLNLAREQSKHATDQLMQATARLGEIMGQLAKVDIQKRNWEEIAQILSKAIAFLCELKRYLNNLVRFFDFVNTLVSIKMREATNRFIKLVRAAEENPGQVSTSRSAGAVNLDAWGRQAIYDHALSLAKISRVVENISGMYVSLYDSNVHPGVNMLLDMGKLVGSRDQQALVAARCEIEEWARNASNRIVQLVNEAQANERDIKKRMEELEKTLGEVVHEAEKEEAKESARATSAAAKENPVYQKMNLFV